MNYSDDNWYLHLEVIDEDQLIIWYSPNWINSKGIDTVRVYRADVSVSLNIVLIEFVTRTEYVEVHAQEIIVDPSAVKSEETHHQNDVSQLTGESQWSLCDLLIVKNEIEPESEKN